jgi:hypothetical protein
MSVEPDPNDPKSIPPDDRKRFEEIGEAYLRRVMSTSGFPYPLAFSAIRWLAELDAKQRELDTSRLERAEAFQIEQTRVGQSTLKAAWIAAYVAIASIIITIGVAFVQYEMAKAEVAHNNLIKQGLGKYIAEGRSIMDKFGENETPMPILDKVGWIGRVKDFLHTNFDDSYVTRFDDISGLGSSIAPVGTDPMHRADFGDIYFKIARLEEFSHELR